jgi:hypothetical protein
MLWKISWWTAAIVLIAFLGYLAYRGLQVRTRYP